MGANTDSIRPSWLQWTLSPSNRGARGSVSEGKESDVLFEWEEKTGKCCEGMWGTGEAPEDGVRWVT